MTRSCNPNFTKQELYGHGNWIGRKYRICTCGAASKVCSRPRIHDSFPSNVPSSFTSYGTGMRLAVPSGTIGLILIEAIMERARRVLA